jgi:hypothetical protein
MFQCLMAVAFGHMLRQEFLLGAKISDFFRIATKHFCKIQPDPVAPFERCGVPPSRASVEHSLLTEKFLARSAPSHFFLDGVESLL